MTKNYLVIQKYYDSGMKEKEILRAEIDHEIIEANGYYDGEFFSNNSYDEYVDAFDTMEEAERFESDTMMENGVTTTTVPGQEKYVEISWIGHANKLGPSYRYDYRHTDGELFSCYSPTIKACREERDAWLKTKKEESR